MEKLLNSKVPPNDCDAEKAVIGGIFLNKSILNSLSEILVPEDFYYVEHKLIYNACLSLFNAGNPIDLLSVKIELERRNQFDLIGELTLMECVLDLSTASNAEYHAQIIKELSVRRKLIIYCTNIISKSFNPAIEVDVLLNDSEQQIFSVSQQKSYCNFINTNDLLLKVFENIEKNANNKSFVTGVSTGYRKFDELTSGLQPSDLVILAARPSMGKTALAVNIALNSAMRAKTKVAFFSLEMSKEQLMMRMLCVLANLSLSSLRKGMLGNDEMKKLYACTDYLSNTDIFIDDSADLSTLDLRGRCRRLKAEKGLDLVIVDYLQLMKSSKRTEAREQEISDISRNLKILAKELNVPVLALSQLNRRLEERSEKRPMLSDLRESGAIEQDADLIFFVYRDEVYNKNSTRKNIAEIIVGKQRNGPIGSFDLLFNGYSTTFRELRSEPNCF